MQAKSPAVSGHTATDRLLFYKYCLSATRTGQENCMDDTLALDTLFRWLHVGTAIVLLGGSVFMRFVLMPAAARLPTDAHETLRGHLMSTWKWFVHVGILLLLASGLYNYLAVMIPRHKGDGLYHALMGIKILVALGIFFLAEVLVGRAPAFEGLRQKRKLWLGVIVGLGAVVVAISGFLKVRPWTPV
jgi:uncharacterized membrane protein